MKVDPEKRPDCDAILKMPILQQKDYAQEEMPVGPELMINTDDKDELLKTIKLPIDLQVIILQTVRFHFLSNLRQASLKLTTSNSIQRSTCHQCENNENFKENKQRKRKG